MEKRLYYIHLIMEHGFPGTKFRINFYLDLYHQLIVVPIYGSDRSD